MKVRQAAGQATGQRSIKGEVGEASGGRDRRSFVGPQKSLKGLQQGE